MSELTKRNSNSNGEQEQTSIPIPIKNKPDSKQKIFEKFNKIKTFSLMEKFRYFAIGFGILIIIILSLYVHIKYSSIETPTMSSIDKAKLIALNIEQWAIIGVIIVSVLFECVLICLFRDWPVNIILSIISIMISCLIMGFVIGIHTTRFFLPSPC